MFKMFGYCLAATKFIYIYFQNELKTEAPNIFVVFNAAVLSDRGGVYLILKCGVNNV
jgi:hypothetical protein